MTVPVYAIICTGDKFLSEKFQKEEARKLGIDGTPFNDADHSPMISLPIELCDIIVKQGRSDV